MLYKCLCQNSLRLETTPKTNIGVLSILVKMFDRLFLKTIFKNKNKKLIK